MSLIVIWVPKYGQRILQYFTFPTHINLTVIIFPTHKEIVRPGKIYPRYEKPMQQFSWYKALCWLIYNLACNPEIQEKVYDEIQDVIGKNVSGIWTALYLSGQHIWILTARKTFCHNKNNVMLPHCRKIRNMKSWMSCNTWICASMKLWDFIHLSLGITHVQHYYFTKYCLVCNMPNFLEYLLYVLYNVICSRGCCSACGQLQTRQQIQQQIAVCFWEKHGG